MSAYREMGKEELKKELESLKEEYSKPRIKSLTKIKKY